MTAGLPNMLPAPGGSQQEVLFRRMLLQCSQRAPSPPDQVVSNGNTADWRSDPKFHCIVEALQEKLYDLEHAGPDVRPGSDVLAQYQAAVRAIASQLQQPQLPAYCWRVSAQDRLAGAAGDAAHAGAQRTGRSRQAQETSSSRQPGRLSNEKEPHQHQQSQQPQQPSSSTAGRLSGTAAAGRAAAGVPSSSTGLSPSTSVVEDTPPSFSLSSRGHQVLATQQRLQDELTDELLDMGAELKSSTLAMQNAIRYRGKLLDDTETHLVNSTENAKAVAAKAKQQYKQGNWNLCHTCIIVLTVTVVFAFMLVYIRLSSMVGLRGR